MKKLNAKIKIGTKVKICAIPGWQTVKSIDNERKLFRLNGWIGMWQVNTIEKFTNK